MRLRALIPLLLVALPFAACSSDDATPAPATGTAVTTATASATASPTVTAVVVEPATPFDDNSSAISTLASLYNALNLGDFERAYTYYDPPPTATFEEYREAYATFGSAIIAVEPPGFVSGEGATMTSQVPTLLFVSNTDSTTQVFAGCFTLRPGEREPDRWFVAESSLLALPESEPQLSALGATAGCESRVGPGTVLDDRSSPAAVLASLVNALNRGEFERAYGYWASPPGGQTLEEYAGGFAETQSTLVAIAPPEPALTEAGNERADIATLLAITRAEGNVEYFAGCYVARRPAGDPAAPWRLVDRSVFAFDTADVRRLVGICGG